MLQRERETNTNRPRHLPRLRATEQQQQQQQQQQPPPVVAEIVPLQPSSTVTSSIVPRTQRAHNHRVVFSTKFDSTCLFQKGQSCPLVEQATTVVKGASKLRASSRSAIKARYESPRISQTNGIRHVGFDPAVKAETGLATSTFSLYLRCRTLLPIREEEGRKRRRDPSVGFIDAVLAIEPKSKKSCLRANRASEEVNRRGIKRKCDTTTPAIAENGEALERKFKRACIRAEESHVQSEVVEVSRFIDCSLFLISLLCQFSSSQSDTSYCSIHPLPSCLCLCLADSLNY